MKRWALLVVFLYFFILVALTWPLFVAAFYPAIKPGDAAGVFLEWPYWLWVTIMVLGQAALLTVPVHISSHRPVARQPLLLPTLASGLMMAGLVVGAIFSLLELAGKGEAIEMLSGGSGAYPRWIAWNTLIAGALVWCIWTWIFYRLGRHENPADMVSRQCRLLLKGSILELLIAVPTHIIARNRDYCCAGFMTFLGLTLGISVMIFSFGPAVFFLFFDRWKRLHPPRDAPLHSPLN